MPLGGIVMGLVDAVMHLVGCCDGVLVGVLMGCSGCCDGFSGCCGRSW